MWNDPRFAAFLKRVWDGCEYEDDKITVHNFAHDGRICEAFSRALLDLIAGSPGTDAKQDFAAFKSLARGFEAELRARPSATFCHGACNRCNLLSAEDARSISGVTVVNLSRVLAIATNQDGVELSPEGSSEIEGAVTGLGFSMADSASGIEQRLETIDAN